MRDENYESENTPIVCANCGYPIPDGMPFCPRCTNGITDRFNTAETEEERQDNHSITESTSSGALKVIGFLLIIAGIIAVIIGAHKTNEAKSFLSAIDAGARLFGYDSDYYKGVNAWTEHAENGKKIEIAGFVAAGIGIVFILIGVTQSNADIRAEKAMEQEKSPHNPKTAKERIKEIDELHDSGLLTDEEYIKKRQEIIRDL